MQAPNVRLGQFLADTSTKRADLAAHLECSEVMVGHLIAGTRVPGTGIAQRIEAATAKWSEGPIRTEEWAVVDDEKRRARKKARAA